MLVAGVYRPPSAKAQDDMNIGKSIENVHLFNRETNLLENINIDYLNKSAVNKHQLVKTLGNLHFTQVVKDITRPMSRKYLDHIWVNYPDRLINVGTRDIALSDHLPVLTTRLFKGQGIKQRRHNVFVYRDLKRLDKARFVHELNEASWNTAFIFDDIDDIVSCWYEIFNSILDNLLPAGQKKLNVNRSPYGLLETFTTK